MLSKKMCIPILALVCFLSTTACNKNDTRKKDTVKINPVEMNMNLEALPYEDLEKEWSNMNMDKYILRTAQQIWNTWNKLDKLWPGVDYSKYDVLYVETNGENAWLISKDKKITKMKVSDLPSKFKSQGEPFEFNSSKEILNLKPTIKVEVDSELFNNEYNEGEFRALPSSSMLFTFTIHEEFHNYQDSWKIDETDKEKLLQEGVENFGARSQRLEIINALNKAILEPEKEQQHIEAAKWWFEQYKKDNSKEFEMVKSIDILEGTARYFDMATNIRSINTEDLDEKEAMKMYQDLIREDYKLESKRFFGLPDEESYDIGGSVGILLEKHKNEEWKKEAEKGILPLEILLKDYKAVPQSESIEVKKLMADIKEYREKIKNEQDTQE